MGVAIIGHDFHSIDGETGAWTCWAQSLTLRGRYPDLGGLPSWELQGRADPEPGAGVPAGPQCAGPWAVHQGLGSGGAWTTLPRRGHLLAPERHGPPTHLQQPSRRGARTGARARRRLARTWPRALRGSGRPSPQGQRAHTVGRERAGRWALGDGASEVYQLIRFARSACLALPVETAASVCLERPNFSRLAASPTPAQPCLSGQGSHGPGSLCCDQVMGRVARGLEGLRVHFCFCVRLCTPSLTCTRLVETSGSGLVMAVRRAGGRQPSPSRVLVMTRLAHAGRQPAHQTRGSGAGAMGSQSLALPVPGL